MDNENMDNSNSNNNNNNNSNNVMPEGTPENKADFNIKKYIFEMICAVIIMILFIIAASQGRIRSRIIKKIDEMKEETPVAEVSLEKIRNENEQYSIEYAKVKKDADTVNDVLNELKKSLDDVNKDIENKKSQTEELKKKIKIKTGVAEKELHGKQYKEVEKILSEKGFINIRSEGMGDMIIGLLVSEGEVDSVSIAGNSDFTPNDKFTVDSEVVIKYHSYKDK